MNRPEFTTNPLSTTNLIIVMGVAGSGKSTLAKAIADRYDYEYLDGDDFHSASARALMAEGVPLTDADRAPWADAITQRLKDNATNKTHTVLAFSGLKQKHREQLRGAGLRTVVIHLIGDKSTIQDRINKRKGHFMAPALLESQFSSMEAPIQEPDVYCIEVGTSLENVIQQAQAILRKTLLIEDSAL